MELTADTMKEEKKENQDRTLKNNQFSFNQTEMCSTFQLVFYFVQSRIGILSHDIIISIIIIIIIC